MPARETLYDRTLSELFGIWRLQNVLELYFSPFSGFQSADWRHLFSHKKLSVKGFLVNEFTFLGVWNCSTLKKKLKELMSEFQVSNSHGATLVFSPCV